MIGPRARSRKSRAAGGGAAGRKARAAPRRAAPDAPRCARAVPGAQNGRSATRSARSCGLVAGEGFEPPTSGL